MEQIIEIASPLPAGWFEKLEKLVEENKDLQDVALQRLYPPPGVTGGGLSRQFKAGVRSARKLALVILTAASSIGAADQVATHIEPGKLTIETPTGIIFEYDGSFPMPDPKFHEFTLSLTEIFGKDVKIVVKHLPEKSLDGD
jgi:hypothetical protein